ncbi:hypothetical protein H5410_046418 [Solanum commersonii]|uniref:Uncharacterized protein n=1 Tax=Solanum commersonii TaxID=4109 RepID=A0A9J5XGF3_SOLCO|nr:hypothetical protein H5410_046418 [Solanum commersonii]
MFLCLLGVNWVMLKTTLELLSKWEGIGNRGRKEHWWRTIPASIWWTLWKERNSRCFDGHNSYLQKIRTNCNDLYYKPGSASILKASSIPFSPNGPPNACWNCPPITYATPLSPFEDGSATKLIGDEGSPRLSPLVTRRLPFTTLLFLQFKDETHERMGKEKEREKKDAANAISEAMQ